MGHPNSLDQDRGNTWLTTAAWKRPSAGHISCGVWQVSTILPPQPRRVLGLVAQQTRSIRCSPKGDEQLRVALLACQLRGGRSALLESQADHQILAFQ